MPFFNPRTFFSSYSSSGKNLNNPNPLNNPKQNKNLKKRPLISLVIAATIALAILTIFPPNSSSLPGFLSYFYSSTSPKPPSIRSSPVIVMEAKMLPIIETIEAIGTAQANESVDLTSNVTETVSAIHFQEGQFVEKGTVVVELLADAEKAALDEAEKQFERVENLTQTQAATLTRRDEMLLKLKVAQANLNNRMIQAPFSGILGLRKVSEGSLVSPGTVITTLDDVSAIKLIFSVPEKTLSEIALGQKIEATSVAYPEKVFQGTIYVLDTRLDLDTRAFSVKALIPNLDKLLKPGMLLHVNIVAKESQGILLLEEAIYAKKEEKFVYVVKEGKTKEEKILEMRPVTLGRRFIGSVEILSGVKEGELVVAEGTPLISPGASVTVAGVKTFEQSAEEFQRLKE